MSDTHSLQKQVYSTLICLIYEYTYLSIALLILISHSIAITAHNKQWSNTRSTPTITTNTVTSADTDTTSLTVTTPPATKNLNLNERFLRDLRAWSFLDQSVSCPNCLCDFDRLPIDPITYSTRFTASSPVSLTCGHVLCAKCFKEEDANGSEAEDITTTPITSFRLCCVVCKFADDDCNEEFIHWRDNGLYNEWEEELTCIISADYIVKKRYIPPYIAPHDEDQWRDRKTHYELMHRCRRMVALM